MTDHFRSSETELVTHAADYHHVMLAVKWVAIHFAAVVVFLTLWLGTPAGFVRGLIAGVVVFAGGVYAMNHGLAHSSEHGGEPDARH
jgi:hypothetical protein